MVRIIEVVPYNPDWANQYCLEAKRITSVLTGEIIEIHHIGSTAIISTFSKPIIDILAIVRNISVVDRLNDRMIEIGYRPMGEYGIEGRRFFVKGTDELRICHLHTFQVGNLKIMEHLYIRDYLRANPNIAIQYSDLKRRLAQEYSQDIDKYMEGKNSFITNVIQTAD